MLSFGLLGTVLMCTNPRIYTIKIKQLGSCIFFFQMLRIGKSACICMWYIHISMPVPTLLCVHLQRPEQVECLPIWLPTQLPWGKVFSLNQKHALLLGWLVSSWDIPVPISQCWISRLYKVVRDENSGLYAFVELRHLSLSDCLFILVWQFL